MKKFCIALLLVISVTSCKKAIENAARDFVLEAMTNGQWSITRFTQNGNDITSGFAGYSFQYYKNETVDAIKNGVVEKTGTWKGDANSMSISASFNNAGTPLVLINGTWKITKNSLSYVEAEMSTGSEIKTLRLDKL
jgi:hypothetical protein